MPHILPAIPTMSLGHGAFGHSMRKKLEAAASVGFKGVEVSVVYRPGALNFAQILFQLFYPCLESFSLEFQGSSRNKLREAARQTKLICEELDLAIIVLQPILNYDGIKDPKEHNERMEEIVFRMEVRS